MEKNAKIAIAGVCTLGLFYFLNRKKTNSGVVSETPQGEADQDIDIGENVPIEELPEIVNNDDHKINDDSVKYVDETGNQYTSDGRQIIGNALPTYSYPNGIGKKLGHISTEVQGFAFISTGTYYTGTYYYQDSTDNHYYKYDKRNFDKVKSNLENYLNTVDTYTIEDYNRGIENWIKTNRQLMSTDQFYKIYESTL